MIGTSLISVYWYGLGGNGKRSYTLAFNESLLLSETLTTRVLLRRAFSETLSLVETMFKKLFMSFNETLQFTEVVGSVTIPAAGAVAAAKALYHRHFYGTR